ncbi:MAG: ABC transporter ATP-binding protein/permease [Treponema sp.]|nr:ABC transporter ATP-binding protein/permease [Treponema sp.]
MKLPWTGGRAALVFAAANDRRFRFFLCCFTTIAAVAFSFLTPQIIRYTIDSGLGNEPLQAPAFVLSLVDRMGGMDFIRSNIWICAFFILGAALLSAVCHVIRRYTGSEIGETVSWRLHNTLYGHIQKLPYDWHVGCQTGDIIQRCTTDVDNIRNFIQNQLSELMRTLCVFVVALVMMFSMDVFMTLVSLALIPVILVFSMVYFRKVSREFARADEAEGVMQAAAQENYTGVRVVRAFGREAYEMEKFAEKTKNYQDIWVRIGKMLGLFWGAGDLFTGLQLAIVIGAGVWRSVQGQLSPGTFLAFYTYCNWMIWPVRSLGRILADLSKTLVAAGRIKDILCAEPETDPPEALTPDLRGEVCFNNVTFGYEGAGIGDQGPGTRDCCSKDNGTTEIFDGSPNIEPRSPIPDPRSPILRNISFSLKPGESLAILGATGSGKSTLVHLLSRLYDVQEGCGEITINGVDIRRISRHHLRRHIGLCLQEPFLFSKTIKNNIAMVQPQITDGELKSAAAAAVVDDTIESFAEGYNTIIGERGVTLSGGQKQRVAIARMLAGKPPVMIFDDSFSAVDTETDAKIRAALRQRVKEAAVIIISHRISSLMQADKILVLKHGTVEDIGSHEELLERGGSYRRIFELQRGIADDNDDTEGTL